MKMSSNHVQEFQFSKFSESRKTLDAPNMENAADLVWQKEEESSEYESRNDYRKSLAWDSAFFTSPGILDPEELLQRLNVQDVDHKRTEGFCGFNTRRSLAWNSAFFTSAGVLEPEELSIVNKGFNKSGAHVLPERIDERIWRPSESNHKIYSDGCSLASLEIGLFDDLKASLYETSKASNVTASSSKFGRGNDLQNTHSLTKFDVCSRVKMKSVPASKGQSLDKKGSERITKAASLPPQAQVARSGSCTPLSSRKPPNVSSRFKSPSTSLNKRASSGSKHIKMENKSAKAAAGQHQQMTVSKRPCLGKSCSIIPDSRSIPKSPSWSSHTPISKSARLGSALSDSTGISPMNSVTRKIDSRLGYLPRNTVELLNTSLPSHLLSSLKSCCASPTTTSSFDIWSSESSASDHHRSNNSTESQVSDSEDHICDHNCSTHGDKDTRFRNQQANSISTENNSVLTNISSNIKPSGLRMPSPKIGFFDAENSMAPTPDGHLKFHHGVQRSYKTERAVAHYNRSATRTMHGKLQSARTCARQTGDRSYPLHIRPSHLALVGEHRGTQEFVKIGLDSRGAKKQFLKEHEDANRHRPLSVLNVDNKENLCCFLNQVEGLSKHLEAFYFNQDA